MESFSPQQRRRVARQLLRRLTPGQLILLLLLLVIVSWLFSKPEEPPPPEAIPEGTARVVRVIDGDTLLFERGVRVRLIGVDTPETVKPGTPVEPWGPEATEFTREFIGEGHVRIQFDRERKDRYGRFLAYVWVGERMLNEELIRAGLGRAALNYRFSEAMKRRFRRAEREAQAAQRGIWSTEPVPEAVSQRPDWHFSMLTRDAKPMLRASLACASGLCWQALSNTSPKRKQGSFTNELSAFRLPLSAFRLPLSDFRPPHAPRKITTSKALGSICTPGWGKLNRTPLFSFEPTVSRQRCSLRFSLPGSV